MQVERYQLLEKLEPLPLKVRLVEQSDILAGLSDEELGMLVDLRPFMQRTPFILQVNIPLMLVLHTKRFFCLFKCLVEDTGQWQCRP